MSNNKNGKETDKWARLREIAEEARKMCEGAETGELARVADEFERAIEAYCKANCTRKELPERTSLLNES